MHFTNEEINVQRILEVLTVLLLFAPNNGVAAAQAADFGFRISVGDCPTEQFDSFTGELTKQLVAYPVQTAKVHIVLTDAQMAAIYRAVEDIRFFDLPATFVGVPTGVQEVTTTDPYTTYRLEVRNGGVDHTVVWRDAYKPTTPEADHFRDLFNMVLRFIHEHPEFNRLPPGTLGCM